MSPRKSIAIGVACLLIGAAMATVVSAGAADTSGSNGGKQCAPAGNCGTAADTAAAECGTECGSAAPVQAADAAGGACVGCDMAQ